MPAPIFLHFGTAHESVDEIKRGAILDSLIIIDQVHGIDGQVITPYNKYLPFKSAQGDFLVTQERNVGLGILTADCLPIVFVDKIHDAIGIAHAGWRGSVQNIAQITVARMQQQYATQIADLSVFFGPCAKVCCYQVQPQFTQNYPAFADANKFFVQRDVNLFFDLPSFNKSLLISAGVPQTAINEQYNCCTICNDDYFSFRRQVDAAGRNLNVVWMR